MAMQVAKAFALKNTNLQNKGRYGHLAEDIMTTQHGPDRVFKVLACARVCGCGCACVCVCVHKSGDGWSGHACKEVTSQEGQT
jgi:hypothetical protein